MRSYLHENVVIFSFSFSFFFIDVYDLGELGLNSFVVKHCKCVKPLNHEETLIMMINENVSITNEQLRRLLEMDDMQPQNV